MAETLKAIPERPAPGAAGVGESAMQASSSTAGPIVAWWMPLAVFVTAFVLRLFNVGKVSYWLNDSVLNVPNAESYTRFGFLGPDNWWTQPLKHVLLYVSATAFGSDPIGWRMRNVLFGAGIVLVTYLLTQAITRRPVPALTAAIVVALDPLHLAFSRSTSEDIPATFFMVLASWLFIRAMKSDTGRDWTAVGLSLGLGWSLRWYAVLPGLLMLALAMVKRRTEGPVALSRLVAYMGPLPFAVYVVTYLPWARRGYSVAEWVRLNLDALKVQSSGLQGVLNLPEIAGPHRWFTAWVGAAVNAYDSGGHAAIVNNPPVWILFVPAACLLLWVGFERRNASVQMVGGSFLLLYLFFLSAQRPILLYSALPIVPFGAVAVGVAAERLLKKRAWLVGAWSAAWGLYLFPLASAVVVPTWAYAWILAKLAVKI